MKTDKFVIAKSSHGMPCIQANDLSEEQANAIREIITDNWMDSADYKAKKGCSPFLQGFNPRGDSSWVLVEFWLDEPGRIQAFIDHVNTRLKLS